MRARACLGERATSTEISWAWKATRLPSYWGIDNKRIRPASCDSRAQCAVTDVQLFSPLCNSLPLPPSRQESILARVPVLLHPQGPPNVARHIAPTVVNSIKSVSGRRSSPNGCQEHLEPTTTDPRRADRDATPSVVGKLPELAIRATLDHVLPGHVLGASSIFRHVGPSCRTGSAARQVPGGQTAQEGVGCGMPSAWGASNLV